MSDNSTAMVAMASPSTSILATVIRAISKVVLIIIEIILAINATTVIPKLASEVEKAAATDWQFSKKTEHGPAMNTEYMI